MSGVFGVIDDKDHSRVTGLLTAMGEEMTHRPWFQVDTFCDRQAGVGLGRVGIGVFNSEAQPVTSEDESILLFMAGEFYDCADTRRELERKGYCFRDSSDAEFALRLYQDRGADFVKAVEGVFATAVWDRSCLRLMIANDRFGFKPLYYARSGGKFIFAPEIKGILADRTFPKTLNLTAVAEYMRFRQLLGEKTFFEGVNLLLPASILCFDCELKQLTRSTYWDWRSIHPAGNVLDDQEIAEEAVRLLRRAVNVRLERAQRPGLYLSGGLDSRSLLSVIDDKYQPVTTVTYGQPQGRDAYLAPRVARAAGARHYFIELTDGNWVKDVADFHLELVEGGHPYVHAHAMPTLPKVRELMDVCITGHGGQVLMETRYQNPTIIYAPDEEAFVSGMFQLYTQEHTWPGLTEAEEYGLYTNRYRPKLRDLALRSLRSELAQFYHPDNNLRSLFFNIYNHDRRLTLNTALYTSSHVENRIPLYDYRLVEWIASLPFEKRLDRRIPRSIISRAAPRLALIPCTQPNRLPTTNRLLWGIHAAYTRVADSLGRRLSLATPRPFLRSDPENYLRHELRDWAEAILFDERTLARGIFRPEALRSLMDRHLAGHEQWILGKIAPIITFEMLLRRFLDGPAE
jgi:asparagine synthase (glutamine-hydrolysing)